MPENVLFKKLCNADLLKMGWHLAQLDSRDDFIADPAGYSDFAATLDARLDYLVEELNNRRYRSKRLIEIDVPKSSLSVRPGSVLPIDDSTVLHAIIILIAPMLDRKLSPEVYSYRLHRNWRKRVTRGLAIFREGTRTIPFLKGRTIRRIGPLKSWYRAWPDFARARVRAVEKEGYSFLTRTDITAFFENIDLNLLADILHSCLPREPVIVNLLSRILHGWTRHTPGGRSIGRGIPQGNDVSSFLANVYLLELDHRLKLFCARREAKWFRYVDDVEIFCKRERDARDAVFEINESLRRLHLNLQGSKTDILSGDRLFVEHDDSKNIVIDDIWNNLQRIDCRKAMNQKEVTTQLSRLRPIVREFRVNLPDCIKDLDKKDSRILRRALTIYRQCGRPYLKGTALKVLEELPEQRMLEKALSYLCSLNYSDHGVLASNFISLVGEGSFPLPLQQAVVLEHLKWLHPDPAYGFAPKLRRFALRTTNHWAVRAKAAESMITYPYSERYVLSMAESLVRSNHPWLRRAGCLVLARARISEIREALNKLIYHPDDHVVRICLLWSRYLQDSNFVLSEIARYRFNQTDAAFVRLIPHLYVIRCSENAEVINRLRDYLTIYERTKSRKISWHLNELASCTSWVEGQ